MISKNNLSIEDRFLILEELNKHQRAIDTQGSAEDAEHYCSLYWPEAKFNVFDLRKTTFEGFAGMKDMFNYAHTVFPIQKWFHTVGAFEIRGEGDVAYAEWRWLVSWREDEVGTVSSGTYEDRFERRNGVWKCIERTSRTDPNWPAELFQSYIDAANNAK